MFKLTSPLLVQLLKIVGANEAHLKVGDTIKKIIINDHESLIASFSDIQEVLDNDNLNLSKDFRYDSCY